MTTEYLTFPKSFTHRLRLGCVGTRSDALHKIHSWAKTKNKSFTILSIRKDRNYPKHFNVLVEYFSSKKAGKYQLGNWDWKEYCLNGKRFQIVKN